MLPPETRWRAYLTKEGRCCDTCAAPDFFRSMYLLLCSECAPRCRSIPSTLQDYLPITVLLYFPDQLLWCPQPPRFEMFPHHAGRTNPRPGVTVSSLSILPGYISTSVSGSGSGLSFHLETDVCSQFPWRDFLFSLCSATLRSAADLLFVLSTCSCSPPFPWRGQSLLGPRCQHRPCWLRRPCPLAPPICPPAGRGLRCLLS
jgi:hypothetical protein